MSVILIVDDHAEHIYYLQALLTGHGFDVIPAPHGEQALALAKASPPDLIISDILMPVMDGFALCQAWKKDPGLQSIPFVFYTATYTDPRDEHLARNLGADRFLVKPMEPDALLDEVRAALADRGAEPPARETHTSESVVMREYNQALVRKLELKLAQLEESLRQEEESQRRIKHFHRVLRAIFESARDGILLYDNTSDHFVTGNQAMSQMLGYDAHELQTLTMAAIHPEDRLVEVRAVVARQLRGELALARDVPLRRKDGTVFLADVNATPLDLDGRRHLLGIFRDVTAQNNLQAQLLHAQKLEAAGQLARAALPGGHERILLVEDEKSIRLTTQAFLAALGYAVESADHPEQALRLAAEGPDAIHLLITDVVMPGLNGRELANRLVKEHPTMKCLFMSGYTDDLISHHGILDEGVAFLSKPFSRDALAHKVRAVLDGTEPARPTPTRTEAA